MTNLKEKQVNKTKLLLTQDFQQEKTEKESGFPVIKPFLPARASEQGNVIGLVSVYIYIYIYMSSKKNCN